MNRVRRWLRVREKPAPFYGGWFVLSVALSIFNSNESKGANMEVLLEVLFEVRKIGVSLLTRARVGECVVHFVFFIREEPAGDGGIER